MVLPSLKLTACPLKIDGWDGLSLGGVFLNVCSQEFFFFFGGGRFDVHDPNDPKKQIC